MSELREMKPGAFLRGAKPIVVKPEDPFLGSQKNTKKEEPIKVSPEKIVVGQKVIAPLLDEVPKKKNLFESIKGFFGGSK